MDKCIRCEFFMQRGDHWDCSARVCPYEENYLDPEVSDEDYPNIDDI